MTAMLFVNGLALGWIAVALWVISRKVDRLMSKFDDLTAAVTEFQGVQTDLLTAIDTEVQQVADAVNNGTAPPSLQDNIDRITAATAAGRVALAKLTGDDVPAPAPVPTPTAPAVKVV